MKVTSTILVLTIFLFSCKSQNSTFNENQVLLKLINKRLQVAPLVAKSKWNTKKAIDDPIREKVILDSIDIWAMKSGVNRIFAHDFFQSQFEAGKIKQKELHDKWTTQNQAEFFPVPDLATEVRPVLDSLTPLLLIELGKVKPKSCNNNSLKRFKKEARKVIDSSFDDKIVETAIFPVENYCRRK